MIRELPPTGSLQPHLADLLRDPGVPFEVALSAWLDIPEVQVECSGTACLYIALEYLKGLSPARQVVILGYTCPLVAIAAHRAGLEVRVCDTAADSFDFDFERLPGVLNPATLCVVATHWGGVLADVRRLCDSVRAHAPGAWVIEDCAQAFGATVEGRSVGLTGHLGFFSFAAGKGLSLYEGGCLISRDPQVRRGLRATAHRLVARRPLWDARRALELLAYHLLYRPPWLYFAYGLPRRYWMARGDLVRALADDHCALPLHRMGAWRQRVGAAALGRYRSHLEQLRATHRRLERRLAQVQGLRVYRAAPGARPSCTYVMVGFDCCEAAQQMLRISARAGNGVSRLFAQPISGYRNLGRIVPACELRNASRNAARSVTLTTSPYMTPAEETAVAELAIAVAAASVTRARSTPARPPESRSA